MIKEVAIVLKEVRMRGKGLCGIKRQSFSVRQLSEKERKNERKKARKEGKKEGLRKK